MKKIIFSLIILALAAYAFAGGVIIKDAVNGEYLQIQELSVDVQIINQVALTSVNATFINTLGMAFTGTYAFPLHEEASGSHLSWLQDGTWHDAVISPGEQGPVNPGNTEIYPYLDSYLGKSPMIFPFEDEIGIGDTIQVQLEYVELLDYQNGDVSYSFPLDYNYLTYTPISSMGFSVTVSGGRNVTACSMPGFPEAGITLLDGDASVELNLTNVDLSMNLDLEYSLAMENLGAITFSSFVESDLVPDELGDGFFLSVIEPEPSVDVIQKYFTFVLDRSNLMDENSIDQAKQAATYMVEHLNQGDYFNIVDFNTVANAFALNHVPYNTENQNLALSYIANLEPSGMCNISAAFDTAIPQFGTAPQDVANIIVFLSKGTPNTGILDNDSLVNHINQLVGSTGRLLNIFCFGVGSNINPILMSQIAANNGGSATWVGSGELSDVLIDFYTNIRNPVLLNPTLTLDQTLGPITEVYPVNIPNLYLGTQMLVCGRYPLGTSSLNFSIEGNALGSITSYIFKSDLSTEAVSENVFLMKIWAKMKIEHLMALYDQMNPYSQEAQNLRQEIIDISVAYGVLCKFTSFSDPGVGIGDDPEIPEPASPALICLKGNYPNPFNPNTTIRFELLQEAKEDVLLKIYNARGQLIKTIVLSAKKPGSYNVPWDGRDEVGNIVPAGLYFYCLSSAEERHSGKMVLLK